MGNLKMDFENYNFDYVVEHNALLGIEYKIFVSTDGMVEAHTDSNNNIIDFVKYVDKDDLIDSLAYYNEACVMHNENHRIDGGKFVKC